MTAVTTKERLVVSAGEQGERLDRYVARHLPQLSRAAAQRLIGAGEILVNHAEARSSHRLQEGDLVEVALPPPERGLVPEPIPLDIIYEDEALAVVNKPAGLVVHPAHGHLGGTLLNGLLARYPELREWPQEEGLPGLVHRLDRDTSGLLLVARTPAVRRALRGEFKARRVRKVYLALVIGQPEHERARIEAPIGRDPKARKRMAVLREGGKPAVTEYRVLERLGRYALLEVHPETGRTHQIRVHLAAIGYPVLGDRVYGPQHQPLALDRFFLHAEQLDFRHPVTEQEVTFTAPLPPELEAILEELRR
jgi:23S rRNA pseudouridine1911/1915/1917 synthase